jgi:hypothetical protein
MSRPITTGTFSKKQQPVPLAKPTAKRSAPTPTLAMQVAQLREDVDSLMSVPDTGGGSWKPGVTVAQSAVLPAHTRDGNVITANANGAFPAQDGEALDVGDSLLVWKEGGGTHLENGVYDVLAVGGASAQWQIVRSSWANDDTKVMSGLLFHVARGTKYKKKWFVLSTEGDIVLNTTPLHFQNVMGYDVIGSTDVLVAGVPEAPSGMMFPPSAAGQPYSGMSVAPTDFYGTIDQVITVGHNWMGTGRIDLSKIALQWQQEYAFETIADGPILSESFGQYTSADGLYVVRPVGFTVDQGGNFANWGLSGRGSWLNSSGVQKCIFGETGLITHLGPDQLWLAGQDRILMSGSLQNGTSAGMFYASSIVGHGVNTMYQDINGAWARWYHGSPIIGWMPGGLLRGTVDATAWQITHQFRIGYSSAIFGPIALPGGTQNDYQPTPGGSAANFAICMMLVFTGSSDTTFNGLVGAADGRMLLVVNASSATITFAAEQGGSSPGNRFSVGRTLAAGACCWLVGATDGANLRWRVQT